MKSKPKPGPARPFWQSVLILLAAASGIGYLLSLLTDIPLSNLYFFAAILFLVVAVVPIFTEVGGNARTGLEARREGRPMREAIQEQQESGRYSHGTRITFLYGICGFICFILAFATS